MSSRIAQRTAVVTGAGNGLGKEISLALAGEGARVGLLGRNKEKLAAVQEEIGAAGGEAFTIVCDTTEPASVDSAIATLESEDVSILVNNAGVAGPVASLTDIEPDEWDEVFSVNVRGVFLMCRAVLPTMISSQRGDIINIASVAAKRPLKGRTPYGASKAAVLGLTTTLAFEVAEHGVMVNAISPGPVEGKRMDRNFILDAARRGISKERAREEYLSKAASCRMVTEAEVGDAVVSVLGMTGLCGVDIDLTAGMFAK